MLPIIDFESLADEALINLDLVIEALKTITFIKIDRDLIFSIERRVFNEGHWIIQLEPNTAERRLLEILKQNYEPIKISKRDTLKLLDIIKKQELNLSLEKKTKNELLISDLRIPIVDRKSERFLFVQACIETYMNGCNEFPPNAESLLKYCCTHQVQGYSDLEDTGGKAKARKINFTGDKRTSIRWMTFIEILGDFKEAQS